MSSSLRRRLPLNGEKVHWIAEHGCEVCEGDEDDDQHHLERCALAEDAERKDCKGKVSGRKGNEKKTYSALSPIKPR
jgi:hypothetical protein